MLAREQVCCPTIGKQGEMSSSVEPVGVAIWKEGGTFPIGTPNSP